MTLFSQYNLSLPVNVEQGNFTVFYKSQAHTEDIRRYVTISALKQSSISVSGSTVLSKHQRRKAWAKYSHAQIHR